MREILFRGKAACGMWVQGDLIHRQIWTSKFEVIRIDDNGFDNYTDYEVATDTVGQYTGLTDKNGKKIFEGDIVKIKGKTRYIFYGSSSFRHTNYGEYAAELTNVNTDRDCEVIGNIHDNPEIIRR